MKICFIAPGEISIPPPGWGALESYVWGLYNSLNAIGFETCFINEKDTALTLKTVKEINPDIIHLHYGKHYEIMPEFNCRKIVTGHDGSFKFSTGFHDIITRKYFYDCEFFCLSEFERNFFINIGISPNKIKMIHSAIYTKAFRTIFTNIPKFNRSIFIGKIDDRKRQYYFQGKDLSIDFVGPKGEGKFNANDPCYLGIWTQEQKYHNLTEYANLLLLSISENGGPPLVCLEAMAAGLGIVVSEASSEGLDLNRKFITVIPEKQINNYDFLKKAIQENREYSINNRQEILEYVQQRDFSSLSKIYKSYL